ncbi:MAG: winged helix-turn-helix transcriptional regulator [Deltaproteobacteria bacterium]|nr:winged helix-turn-helix transcriptional regulator [Deltaproteobacteria bacterium]
MPGEPRSLLHAKRKRTVDAIVETVIYLYTESRRLTKERARAYGLTGPQLTVISILSQLGDLSLSSLSERIKAQNSTVTGIIDRMEREGLVRRERSDEDRRIVLIRLTDKGQTLAREVALEPMEIFRTALDGIPRRDIDELFRVLDLVQARVRELVGETDHEATPKEE